LRILRIRNTDNLLTSKSGILFPQNFSNCAGALEKKIGEAQRARAERNRLKALSLQKARLMAHPYTAGQQQAGTSSSDLKGLSHGIDLKILTEIYKTKFK
jgi:hypothetical protein